MNGKKGRLLITVERALGLVLFFLVSLEFTPVFGRDLESKFSSYHLSDLLQDKGLVGLDEEAPDLRLVSERGVLEYLHYRDHTLAKNESLALVERCRALGGDGNPFCVLVLNSKLGPKLGPQYIRLNKSGLDSRGFPRRDEVDPALRRKKRNKARALLQQVSQGHVKTAIHLSKTMSENELSQTFRFVKSSHVLARFASQILQQDSCVSNPLLVALGLRLEEGFPAPASELLVESLYRKAFACGKDQASVAAGYRLGLFQVRVNHCERAEKIFASIPEAAPVTAPVDYRMRIDYWRAVCAVQMKNAELRERLKNQVLKNYPLSLHALILAADLPHNREDKLAKTLDPEVFLRSKLPKSGEQENLLQVLRAAELLLRRGERGTAAVLLKTAIPLVLRTETSFQFYWAVLLQRAGEMAGSFQIVGNIFRQDPSRISKSTLQFLYPMELLDTLQKANLESDPFFILSLVRQESAFDSDARSSAGAQGLMQLQWPTARRFEKVSAMQLWEPRTNLRIGVKYLRQLEKRFQGRLDYSLAAYNAGPERIKGWLRRYPTEKPLLFLDLLPLQETRDYVAAIARNYYWYKRLYTRGTRGTQDTQTSRALSSATLEDGQRLLLLFGLQAAME